MLSAMRVPRVERPNNKSRPSSIYRRPWWQVALLHLSLMAGSFLMLLPFLWMFITSVSNPASAFSSPEHFHWIPHIWYWSNYADVFHRLSANGMSFWLLYWNSLFVAIGGTVGQVLTSSMAAYAFARLRFPGREPLFFGYLATMMVPGSVTLIPVFILMRDFHWINTYYALIIPGIFSPFGTFMLRQFFMSLPRELEEAARIDGASLVGIYWRITLPLSKPAIATLTTFTFLGYWVSFLWPLIVTVSPQMRTLPIGLTVFMQRYTADYSQWMAASVMATVPVILVFLFNQRYFVEGIKLSGIKG